MDLFVFVVAGLIVLVGAAGVITLSHPVHAALSLVATLFGVAVLFISRDAEFLAAVQVIVYAGAIVVLFLFVIMLLGIDRVEDIRVEPIAGQRPAALVGGVAALGLSLVALLAAGADRTTTGLASRTAPIGEDASNISRLGQLLFSRYVFAFEATAILLTVSVVAAVLLARRLPTSDRDEMLAAESELTVDEPGEAVR